MECVIGRNFYEKPWFNFACNFLESHRSDPALNKLARLARNILAQAAISWIHAVNPIKTLPHTVKARV